MSHHFENRTWPAPGVYHGEQVRMEVVNMGECIIPECKNEALLLCSEHKALEHITEDRDSGDEHGGRCLPKEQETIDDLIEEQQRRRLNNPICDHQARVWELEKDKANLEATVRVLLSRLEQLR